MATIALNEKIRLSILDRVLKHGFEQEKQALHEEKLKLGDVVYLDIFPLKLRRRMAKMPEGFLPTDDKVQVRFAGEVDWVLLRSERRLGCNLLANRGHTAAVYEAGHPFVERWRTIEDKERSYVDRREKVRAQARSVIWSCRTLRQLLEVWPEISSLCDDLSEQPKQAALTVSVKDLNEQLGL